MIAELGGAWKVGEGEPEEFQVEVEWLLVAVKKDGKVLVLYSVLFSVFFAAEMDGRGGEEVKDG